MDPVLLPPEIWLYIHQLATSDTSPWAAARSDAHRYEAPHESEQDIQEFLRDACSFVLVCRLWNRLANQLLYENVRVPMDEHRFLTLRNALERPETAGLVRSIRLSRVHFDHNLAILTLCPQVQVVCQPDTRLGYFPSDVDTRVPTLPCLRDLYWPESFTTYLPAILMAAPNLEHLVILPTDLLALTPDPLDALPTSPSLRHLACCAFDAPHVSDILRLNFRHITRLRCAVLHLTLPRFPTLPVLETLELFHPPQGIPFATLFARCPRLSTLCYNVSNDLDLCDPLPARPVPLTCVRLHSTITVVDDAQWARTDWRWEAIAPHFEFFLAPEVPRISRLVLHGSWDFVVADARFAHTRDRLRTQGCQVEFPEGFLQ
ncbi:hypothetical protein DFH07DRAFT_44680 [Mycena maculata]|uniref:F-box domain-containing protein n=1 Tax=Mycena maculata TaxID=230809 RepID=A0AAD7N1E0_9AGAR|nr:hypothetical protein DFH07DRAFT_44680 [Mycena maculata]